MKYAAVIFCAVLSVAVAAEDVDLVRNLKHCRRQAEDTNDCLKDAIQDAILKIVKGIPASNIPVLDPFVTESQEVQYSNGFLNGKMALKNVKTYGTSKARVLDVKSTPSEGRHRLEISVLFPKVLIEGDYKADGGFNDFKIGGKGFFNVSMEGVRILWDITGRIENDRLVVEHFRMLPEVENMKVYFDDLFNGNESINIAARGFINEYWPLFYKEMLPIAAVEWDKQMTEFTNRILSPLPYSQLFT